ncbi:MAG: prepilin-type N-terminal cleavage/methylation domain-containing protein, partial [Gammaproteobacteria bacterium]|nr:prepilin-type N-terminal cleavage/methylation domain-containing protein [Gammaproteobacteria bacterium]
MWRFNGLTLIEVLVAVVILAVLAALGLPALNAYSHRAYRSEAQGDLVACALALERWAGVRFTYQGAADTDADGVGDADDGPIATEVCA